MCPVVLVFLLVWIRTLDGLVQTSDAKNPMEFQSLLYTPAFDSGSGFAITGGSISSTLTDLLTYSEYAQTSEKAMNP